MVTKEESPLGAPQSSNNIYSAPVIPTEAAHKDMGSREKADPDGEGSDDANYGFFQKVRSMLVSCGASDVASFLMQSDCRGVGSAAKDETKQQTIRQMNMRKPSLAIDLRTKRRQGGTLEFHSQGGFDDDVSAISAHTLEEMERSELFRSKKQLPRQARPAAAPSSGFIRPMVSSKKRASPTIQENLDWTYQMPRKNSNTSLSLGVSTSGSASSGEHDEPGRSPTHGSEHEREISTRAEI
jgi:hypothetical protein